MAERTRLITATQLGVEVTKGTAVAANKKLMSTQIMLRPAGNINVFSPSGYKFNTVAAPGKEWATGDISGPASYNDLAYLLSGLVSYAAPDGCSTSWTSPSTHRPPIRGASPSGRRNSPNSSTAMSRRLRRRPLSRENS